MQLGQSQEASSGSPGGPQERQNYREQFIAPDLSIISKLMTKVSK